MTEPKSPPTNFDSDIKTAINLIVDLIRMSADEGCEDHIGSLVEAGEIIVNAASVMRPTSRVAGLVDLLDRAAYDCYSNLE